MSSIPCPPDSDLSLFVAGELSDDEVSAIALHLDSCDSCELKVEELEAGGTSILRSVLRPDAVQSSDDVDLVREILKDRRPGVLRGPDRSWLGLRVGVYEIKEILGYGGMGTVFKAWHTKLKKPVALKALSLAASIDDEAVSRFESEIEVTAKLDHRNIVQATDANDHEGVPYLVMELLTGADVGAVLDIVGPLRVADACELACQAANGIDEAHKLSWVHRDVKPSNLFLTSDGVLKVLDLGLAPIGMALAESAGGRRVCGTAEYIAPEQIEDSTTVDARADLYSLGCTLFEMLAGRPPFPRNEFASIVEQLQAHQEEEPPLLTAIRADVPERLSATVARMLEKSPDKRFQKASEVQESLSNFRTNADLIELSEIVERVRGYRTGTEVQFASQFRDSFHRPVSTTPRRRLVVPALLFVLAAGVVYSALSWWPAIDRDESDASPGIPAKSSHVPNSVIEHKNPSPVSGILESIPSLEEWLVDREIITVSQDGVGDYSNINEAVRAAKSGEAVEVLDAGPYRERLYVNGVQPNIGLFSRCGSIVELDWLPRSEANGEPSCHFFFNLDSFRISGIRFTYGDISDGTACQINDCSGAILEQCLFIPTVKRQAQRAETSLLFATSEFSTSERPVVIRECGFGSRVQLGPSNHSTPWVIQRNWFRANVFVRLKRQTPTMTINQNIFESQNHDVALNVASALEPSFAEISFENNTINAATGWAIMGQFRAAHVAFKNNALELPTGIAFHESATTDWDSELQSWHASHNQYRRPVGERGKFFQISATGLVGEPSFLSTVPFDRDYLRISPDSVMATSGAPNSDRKFIGALPPSDSGQAEDWFTDMMARWKELNSDRL